MTTLFADMEAPQVQEFLVMPEDPDELAMAIADSVWALGTTGKFVWPIPDKGLKKRIHRVAAETLIIWGEHDRLVSPVYAAGVRRPHPRLAGGDHRRAPATSRSGSSSRR